MARVITATQSLEITEIIFQGLKVTKYGMQISFYYVTLNAFLVLDKLHGYHLSWVDIS